MKKQLKQVEEHEIFSGMICETRVCATTTSGIVRGPSVIVPGCKVSIVHKNYNSDSYMCRVIDYDIKNGSVYVDLQVSELQHCTK